jgi:hypothetical protein
MNSPTPQKKAEWAAKAAARGGIVPYFFEVFVNKVELTCGSCRHEFKRPLVPNLNEPLFACPACSARNWIPLTYENN